MNDASSHDDIEMMTVHDRGDEIYDNGNDPGREDEGSISGSDDQIILIMGTYNPPTRAHIAMSSVLRERFPKAQIIYVPSGDAYLKSWKHFDDDSIPDLHLRAQLLREAIAIEGGRDISVSEIEGDASKTDGRTYNTASYFQQTTGKKVAIAIGSDQLDKFGLWYKAGELVRDFQIIIFCRGISIDECRHIVGEMFGPADKDNDHGHGIAVSDGAIHSGVIRNSPDTVEGHFVYIPFEYEGVSSTKIREAVVAGNLESVKDDIPQNVYEYLLKETASF